MKYGLEWSPSNKWGEAWTLNISSLGGDDSFRLSTGGEVAVEESEGRRLSCIFESISIFSSLPSSNSFISLISPSSVRTLSSKDSVLDERQVSNCVRKIVHRAWGTNAPMLQCYTTQSNTENDMGDDCQYEIPVYSLSSRKCSSTQFIARFTFEPNARTLWTTWSNAIAPDLLASAPIARLGNPTLWARRAHLYNLHRQDSGHFECNFPTSFNVVLFNKKQ